MTADDTRDLLTRLKPGTRVLIDGDNVRYGTAPLRGRHAEVVCVVTFPPGSDNPGITSVCVHLTRVAAAPNDAGDISLWVSPDDLLLAEVPNG